MMHHPQSRRSLQMKNNNQTNKCEQVHAGLAGNGGWVVQGPRRFCSASLPLPGIIVSLK